MSFTCNGTIVDLTVAGRPEGRGMQSNSPIIQIWRPQTSSKGPTNYVFESQELISDPTVNLHNATFENNQLPQIAVDVDSESGNINLK